MPSHNREGKVWKEQMRLKPLRAGSSSGMRPCKDSKGGDSEEFVQVGSDSLYFLGECIFLGVHWYRAQKMVSPVSLKAGLELCDSMGKVPLESIPD